MKANFLNIIIATAAAASFTFAAPVASEAADASYDTGISDPWAGTKWLVRGRIIGVLPDVSNATIGGAPAPTFDADDSLMPELDITYFLNDNFALELILAVSPHDATLGGAVVTDLLLLPPTLTLQYHMPMGNFKPYVGAGINLTFVIDSSPTAVAGFVDDWDASVGFALQAGFDYAIDDHWSFNLDVKKLWLGLDGTITAGLVPVSVDIDPWIVGVGIGYRF